MIAQLFHAHHSLYDDDLPFWLGLAARSGDPILELGCGTGRVLIPLAQAGHRAFGLDHDPAMLSILQDRLHPSLQSAVSILQAEITNFRLDKKFALIILPCNTYSTFSSEARSSVLDCVVRHLLPVGLFAVSLPNPFFLRNAAFETGTEVEFVFPHPLDGEPVQVSSSWERTSQHFSVHWYYDHLRPDGDVQRLVAKTDHQLVSADVYRDEMRRAGFTSISTFGDFDLSTFSNDSPHLIITCSF